jgi:hypothetical protein
MYWHLVPEEAAPAGLDARGFWAVAAVLGFGVTSGTYENENAFLRPLSA